MPDVVAADLPSELVALDIIDSQAEVPPTDLDPSPDCCWHDDDCDAGEFCLRFDWWTNEGLCLPDLEPGTCIVSGHCADEEYCQGGLPVQCGEDVEVIFGACKPLPDGCCFNDGQCPEGSVCMGMEPDGSPGGCELAPAPGECYEDDECEAGHVCQGASTCPCFMDCTDAGPGKCVQLIFPCCENDADCDDGEFCFDPEGAAICLPVLQEGQCWQDEDCGPDQTCKGYVYCICDKMCGSAVAPGNCSVAPSATRVTGGGHYFGMCAGPCKSDLSLEDGKANLIITGWSGEVFADNSGQMTGNALGQAQDLAFALMGVELKEVYGCPDCADGGASYVSLLREGVESSHLYDWGGPPEPLVNADAFVYQLTEALSGCEETALVVPDGDCQPPEF